MLNVVAVRYVRDYVLWIRFTDGLEGEVDLESELYGEMFEPLRERAIFAQAAVDPDLGTVAWPNRVDLAPEFLQERVRIAA